MNGSHSIAFEYTNDHLLTQAGDLNLTYYHQTGVLNGTTFGNVSDQLQYNSFGELINYSASSSNSSLYTVEYSYDSLVRIKTRTETIGETTNVYRYNYVGQSRQSFAVA